MTSLDESEELTIQVVYEKSDLYSAVRSNAVRHPLFWVVPLVIGSFTYGLFSEYVYGWIIALMICLASFYLVPFLAGRNAVKMPGILAPIIFTFSVDGVTAQFENGKNSAAWSLARGASETDKFIFVEMQRGTFHLVPKSQISQDQAKLLRQLLRKYVRAKVRLSS
jgi:hypothetical protein